MSFIENSDAGASPQIHDVAPAASFATGALPLGGVSEVPPMGGAEGAAMAAPSFTVLRLTGTSSAASAEGSKWKEDKSILEVGALSAALREQFPRTTCNTLRNVRATEENYQKLREGVNKILKKHRIMDTSFLPDMVDYISPPGGAVAIMQIFRTERAMVPLRLLASGDYEALATWILDNRFQLESEMWDMKSRIAKENVAARTASRNALLRAAEAKTAAEAALESARVALVSALPVPLTLDVLLTGISEAKMSLGEEDELDVGAVIARLLPAAAPDEDDWEEMADAVDAPDVVAPIVERYIEYVAAKTALKRLE